jgi:hypothetical protein
MRWLVLLGVVIGLLVGLRYLPPEWDPRAPLNLTAAPSLLTSLKLRWLTLRPEACFAAFAESGLQFIRVPDISSQAGCEVENAVRLVSDARVSPTGPTVTCGLAAAWVLLERNTLQPAARRLLHADIATVRHLGSYACRNINHAATGSRSEHATANAIDIAGFLLRDGREVSVAHDWSKDDPEGIFLHAVRDGACRWFHVVLSPDHDKAHHNHLHLDMGLWHTCD